MKSFLKVLTERTHLSLIPEISDEYTRILLKFQKCSKVKLLQLVVYKKVLVQHY
jgi:F0F1-type ATP synthase delta subunit